MSTLRQLTADQQVALLFVTLILCRETDETARNGLAHAFSSRENSHNSPPTLRLRLEPR